MHCAAPESYFIVNGYERAHLWRMLKLGLYYSALFIKVHYSSIIQTMYPMQGHSDASNILYYESTLN